MVQKHSSRQSYTTGLTFRQLSLREKIRIYEFVQNEGKEKSSYELSQNILEKFGISIEPRTIRKWWGGWKPRWLYLTPSPELVYLLGLVLGDGWIEYKKIANGYYVGVNSTKKEVPELFRDTCIKVLGKAPKISLVRSGDGEVLGYRCMIGSKGLYELVKDGKQNIYKLEDYIERYPNSFIRGLADAEGSVTFYRPKRGIVVQVKITNANRELLLLVRKLLSKMGIYGSIKVNNKKGGVSKVPGGKTIIRKKDIYDLVIARQQDVLKYSELVGFSHPQKKKKLEEAVEFIKSWREFRKLRGRGE